MSDYNPDTWCLVKVSSPDGKYHHRVFAMWYGGYLNGDSWKLNSGITGVTEQGDYFLFDGSSGSVYHCHKKGYGLSGYGLGVITSIIEKSTTVTIEVLEEQPDVMNFTWEE